MNNLASEENGSSDDSSSPPTKPGRLKRILKAVIALVVIVGLGVAIQRGLRQWSEQTQLARDAVAQIDQQLATSIDETERGELKSKREAAVASIPSLSNLKWDLFFAAALLYAIGLIPGGMVLAHGTRTFGYRLKLTDVLAAQIIGHLGKYVPGKAMVVVMRAGKLHEQGVSIFHGTLAVVMETLLMMAVGAALAGTLVLFLPVPRWIALCAFAGGVAAAIPSAPFILRRVLQALKRPANDPESKQAEAIELQRPWVYFVSAWFWQLLAWVFIGGAFAVLLQAIPGVQSPQPLHTVVIACVAAISMAMVAGFVSLLPGGAGVRELTLAIVLSPVVGEARALLAAIAARLLFLIVELVAAGCVVAWKSAAKSDSK